MIIFIIIIFFSISDVSGGPPESDNMRPRLVQTGTLGSEEGWSSALPCGGAEAASLFPSSLGAQRSGP